ncbi:MAG: hypothetical protein JRI25_18590 [Deltaproteobacteria bacterium]|nr:hypothetical protein [Deltaproteobacteria bacterium]MBW2256586.1 hypothetical protein [Deltaproteobacteria bacterium]
MRDEDEEPTELYDGPPMWYPTVETLEELPKNPSPGARCKVLFENAVYLWFDGEWRKLAPPPEKGE